MIRNDKSPIWHPYTQMKLADTPIKIAHAKAAVLFAADGKEYIDAISSWWVNIHGHAHPAIAHAIAEQAKTLEQVIFAGFTHEPAIRLATRLLDILPDKLTKIFYSDNGSTAVEVAIKMALQYWTNQGHDQKKRIIAFENAYHGDTFGAMSVGARSAFSAAFDSFLFQVDFIPAPDPMNIEAVKTRLVELVSTEQVAAFIFEPLVQGAGGMLMHQASLLDELIQIAQDHGVLCIADEVMTGFGRTGKYFATDHLVRKPDLLCMSKGITGGFMPLAVTACSQAIYDAFYADQMDKTFFHGHSYTANPLACAAANASMDLLLDPSCKQQLDAIMQSHEAFKATLASNPHIKDCRQTGTILAIEIQTPESSSYFSSIRNHIYQFCLDRGVLLRPLGNTVYIMPPYCITKAELEKTYSVIQELIESLHAGS